MKKLLIASAIGLAFALAGGAASAQDAKKGPELIKSQGCTEKCHAVDTKKKGPAFKVAGEKFKKAGKDVNAIVKDIKEAHDDMKANDAQLKDVAAWLLTL
jgi:cytochrome c551/c552